MFTTLRSAARWMSHEAGLRFLARRKAACAVAVFTMALALGANTAVFSVVKTFLIASIGVPDAGRVFLISPNRELPGRGSVPFNDAFPNYQLIRASQHTFDKLACVLQGTASWDDNGEARPLQFARVAASFFATMRVNPIVGGPFGADAEGPAPKPVVLISHALWQSGFARDPAIVGKAMRIDGAPYTIIGVMPPGFAQPAPSDIWMPFDLTPRQRIATTGGRIISIFGRLGNARSLTEVDAAMKQFTARTLEANPVDNRDFAYKAQSLRTALLAGADSTVLLVQAGAVVLLLLAVLNLASLLVAWGFERRQELAVRQALGAGRGRVVRMLFLQSVFVVSVGAVVGAAAARLAMPWLRGLDINPQLTYFTSRIQLDTTTLALSAAVAIVGGLLAGVLPAWFNRRVDLATTLRAGSRAVTVSRSALRWQQGMVFVQAALSVVILAAASLLGVSLHNISKVVAGYDPAGRIVARAQLPDARYGQNGARVSVARAILDNLSREPAIGAYGFSSTLPVSDVAWGGRFLTRQPDGSLSRDPLLVHLRRVSPEYITTMGIPLLSGRQLTAHDDSTSTAVVIVSHALAARVWPGEDAVGKQLYRVVAGSDTPQTVDVVGVVGDVMDAGLTSPPGEAVYVPFDQLSTTRLSIVVRPRGTPAEAIAAIRRALRASDPTLAANGVADLETLTSQANALPRLRSFLLLAFALVAIGIAALGSYGVMSQLVTTREREFAMRLVFGAPPARLGGSVFAQVARLTVPGIVIGIAAVLLLGSLLKPFVFGVNPNSVFVLGAVSVGMAGIAVMATFPSALRAMRVDIRRGISAG